MHPAVMRYLSLIITLLLCCNSWAAEVTCLVADFKAALDVPAPKREAAANEWIKTRGADCSYEQLTAIKNNLGSWMGVANSYRVNVELLRHIESYYIAKNEWAENLYTSKAAYVAPYSARTLGTATNVIVSPPPIAVDAFGQPIQPNNGYQNRFNPQQPGYQNYNQPMQPGYQNYNQPVQPNSPNGGYQNNNAPRPPEEYADPNSDW